MNAIQEVDRHVSKIAKGNDMLRKLGFNTTITQGVHSLPDPTGLMNEISRFNDFNENNDPYGEHDFGTVYRYGKKIFWKIDYYNQTLTAWCDPLSDKCRRIMTVMLASEY